MMMGFLRKFQCWYRMYLKNLIWISGQIWKVNWLRKKMQFLRCIKKVY